MCVCAHEVISSSGDLNFKCFADFCYFIALHGRGHPADRGTVRGGSFLFRSAALTGEIHFTPFLPKTATCGFYTRKSGTRHRSMCPRLVCTPSTSRCYFLLHVQRRNAHCMNVPSVITGVLSGQRTNSSSHCLARQSTPQEGCIY